EITAPVSVLRQPPPGRCSLPERVCGTGKAESGIHTNRHDDRLGEFRKRLEWRNRLHRWRHVVEIPTGSCRSDVLHSRPPSNGSRDAEDAQRCRHQRTEYPLRRLRGVLIYSEERPSPCRSVLTKTNTLCFISRGA